MRECPQCRWNFDQGSAKRFAGMTFVPSFPSQQELAYHAVLVHGDLLCPLCPYRYDDFLQRQRHLKRAHGLKPREVKALLPPWVAVSA